MSNRGFMNMMKREQSKKYGFHLIGRYLYMFKYKQVFNKFQPNPVPSNSKKKKKKNHE